MLSQRLIGVVTVRRGLAVQSFGYRRWLPLGRPEVLVENLDRWGADEILVSCIDRSAAKLGPDFELLERLGKLGLSTPLIYAGGIRDADDAVAVVQRAADRVAVDALLHDAPERVEAISSRLGAQAVIAALPLAFDRRRLMWREHRSGSSVRLPQAVLDLLRRRIASEALLIDWQHEGTPGAFDVRLAERFADEGLPFIAFGGLSDPATMRHVLGLPHAVAVAIGNMLAWREHAVQAAKREVAALGAHALREARFQPAPHLEAAHG